MITLFARQWWVADLIANLRVQLILGLFGLFLLLLITRRWRALMFVMAVTVWHATAMQSAFLYYDRNSRELSSTVDSASNKSAEPLLRVFLANVLTGNHSHEQIIAQISEAEPDVIVILELSSELENSLQLQFDATHKYVVSEPHDRGNFGIGLWSRYPLSNDQVFHLNVPILPSIEADVQLPSRVVHVVATHPLPPMGARNFEHRNQHLALLARRIQKPRQGDRSAPLILLGDLNLTPWSPLFEDFQTCTGLQDSGAGRGLQPTWYRWDAFPFGLILDHGLYSENVLCKQRTILPPNGSDHRALVFDFSLNESH